MTPQEIMDAANIDVKNLGRITQAQAISWLNQCNSDLATAGLIYSSIDITLITDTLKYSLAIATGFIRTLELLVPDGVKVVNSFRIRVISSVRYIIFDEDLEAETDDVLTLWYSKRHTELSGANFGTLEMEIDDDFHDLYVHYMMFRFYVTMLEQDLAKLSRSEYERRKGDLKSACRSRWNDGTSQGIRVVRDASS